MSTPRNYKSSNRHYKFPLWKKGDEFITPDGEVAAVEAIEYEGGANWYCIAGAWYSENELVQATRKRSERKY